LITNLTNQIATSIGGGGNNNKSNDPPPSSSKSKKLDIDGITKKINFFQAQLKDGLLDDEEKAEVIAQIKKWRALLLRNDDDDY